MVAVRAAPGMSRHAAQLDRIAVSNVGDFPANEPLKHGAARTDHGKAGKHARESDVHDLLITNVQVEDIDSTYAGTTAMAIVPLPLPPGAEACSSVERPGVLTILGHCCPFVARCVSASISLRPSAAWTS
jgi:hypothetical protein